MSNKSVGFEKVILRHLRDNLFFILISMLVVSTTPAILCAQESRYNPINFTEPLTLARGKVRPMSPNGVYFSKEDSCLIMKHHNGWKDCSALDAFIVNPSPGIDNVVISPPNSEGYVKFDDWSGDEKKDEIDAIWKFFVESTVEQSKNLGVTITPLKWYIYPTLDKEKNYLYYAVLSDWNGQKTINVKACLFDRSGYVPFLIVPSGFNFSEEELKRFVELTLSSYVPEQKQSYTEYVTGDKVAAAGALGVLATLVGVKYGKAAALGIAAIVAMFVKKMWILLLLPFFWIKKLFSKDKSK